MYGLPFSSVLNAFLLNINNMTFSYLTVAFIIPKTPVLKKVFREEWMAGVSVKTPLGTHKV